MKEKKLSISELLVFLMHLMGGICLIFAGLILREYSKQIVADWPIALSYGCFAVGALFLYKFSKAAGFIGRR